MYGTVARVPIKPGRLDDLIALWEEWTRDIKPRIEGAISGTIYKLDADPNQVIMTIAFRDKKSYLANADDPEQDKWYRRMRECMAADPEWNDGEIVATG